MKSEILEGDKSFYKHDEQRWTTNIRNRQKAAEALTIQQLEAWVEERFAYNIDRLREVYAEGGPNLKGRYGWEAYKDDLIDLIVQSPRQGDRIYRSEGATRMMGRYSEATSAVFPLDRSYFTRFLKNAQRDPKGLSLQTVTNMLAKTRPYKFKTIGHGKLWGIPQTLIWELASKIDDVRLRDALRAMLIDGVDSLKAHAWREPSLQKREGFLSILNQVERNPIINALAYNREGEVHDLVDDRFYSPDPVTAEHYYEPDPDEAAYRKKSRSSKKVQIINDLIQDVLDSGFNPTETAAVIQQALLNRLIADEVIEPSAAMMLKYETMPKEVYYLSERHIDSLMVKAKRLGIKFPKKLGIAAILMLPFLEEEEQEDMKLAAAGGIAILPRKNELTKGIASAMYNGDESKVTKHDIKHFQKVWKKYQVYPSKQLKELVDAYKGDTNIDPATRQLVDEASVILESRKQATKGVSTRETTKTKFTTKAGDLERTKLVDEFRTEKMRVEAAMRRAGAELKTAETPTKRRSLEDIIVTAKKRITELSDNIKAALSNESGMIKIPDFFNKSKTKLPVVDGIDNVTHVDPYPVPVVDGTDNVTHVDFKPPPETVRQEARWLTDKKPKWLVNQEARAAEAARRQSEMKLVMPKSKPKPKSSRLNAAKRLAAESVLPLGFALDTGFIVNDLIDVYKDRGVVNALTDEEKNQRLKDLALAEATLGLDPGREVAEALLEEEQAGGFVNAPPWLRSLYKKIGSPTTRQEVLESDLTPEELAAFRQRIDDDEAAERMKRMRPNAWERELKDRELVEDFMTNALGLTKTKAEHKPKKYPFDWEEVMN